MQKNTNIHIITVYLQHIDNMDTFCLYNHIWYWAETWKEKTNFHEITNSIKKELEHSLTKDFTKEEMTKTDVLKEHAKNWIPWRRWYQATKEAIQGYTFVNEQLDTLERLAYGSAGIITIIWIVMLLYNGIYHKNRALGLIEQQALAKISSLILGPAQIKVIARHHGQTSVNEFKQMLENNPKDKLIGILQKLKQNISNRKQQNIITQKLLQYCNNALFTLEYKTHHEVKNTTTDIIEYYNQSL